MIRIVISLLLLLLSQQLPAQQAPTHRENALLWRISATQQPHPSYLFGTIHSEDARVLDLPPAVAQALHDSRHFVMEIVPDANASAQLGRSMLLPAGQRLVTLLDSNLYEQTQRVVVQHGLPLAVIERMKPWALVMMLNMPKPVTGLFLDQWLHDIAVREGKTVSGVETVEEQIETLDGLEMTVQIELLRHTLQHYQENSALTGQLLDAWLRRDLTELQRLGSESNAGLPSELEQLLQTRLLDTRNLRMAARLVPLLERGGTFVAVGALHLPGTQGLITLLRQRGFTVEPLY